MKQGTVSVLFGCHSIIHSLFTTLAWRKLWGTWPKFWEIICILLHDIGHWGYDYLDNEALKKEHWKLGAEVAESLFGRKGRDLVSGHTTCSNKPISKMRMPDKASWLLAPEWWLISNQMFEPKLQRPGLTKRESAKHWKAAVKDYLNSGKTHSLHDIFIKQTKLGDR